jgi:hypothetical protein
MQQVFPHQVKRWQVCNGVNAEVLQVSVDDAQYHELLKLDCVILIDEM